MNGTELLDAIRPVEHRLPNGLTVLVRADHAAPVVAVVTHVKAGYFDEADDVVGVSHVLEHMYFKGTARRGAGEIAQATKTAGGYLNAGTIYDRTSYYTVLPASAVAEGLEIQADALIHSSIDEQELRKELVVIVEEVKRKLDNPSAMATEKLYEAMFDVHPMRRWRMGMPEALERMSRAQVVDYYRSMYRGPNIVLVVAGAVDPDQVLEQVEALYADVPAGGVERPERSEPERDGARLGEMSGDVARTYAQMGWRTPAALHPDTAALDALAIVAGQGRASRLYRGVRERGFASSVHGYNYTPTEIGVFGVGLECEPGRAVDALRASAAEIERLRSDAVDADELARVRTLLESRLLRRLETAEGRANLLAEWEALGGWARVADYLERIRALEPEELRDVAARYLSPDRVTLFVYRPDGAPAIGWADEDVPAALATHPSEPPAQVPVAAASPLEDGTPVGGGPAVVVGAGFTDDGVVQHPLGAGRLVVKHRDHAPLVSLAVVRSGGVLHETPATAGITGLMMRSTLKGTATRTAERIAMESEGMGGSISASAGPDLLSWSMTVPSAQFTPALALLADVASSPEFPEQAVETERAMTLAGLERIRDDMHGFPHRLLFKAAFGDHPYGLGVDETARAVGDATAEDVRRWHRTELGEPWVFVVGDVEAERVADEVARIFAPGGAARNSSPPPPAWPAAPRREEVARNKAQTALALAFPGPPRNHADRPALEVLATAVSGLGNRLFEELRSRRSLAYTVSAYPMIRRDAGAFIAYIATSPERGDEARAALLYELARLRSEPPTEEELERARRYAIGSWQIQTQTNAAQLSDLAVALMIGEGLDEILEYEARTLAVTRDHVLAAAQRWFDESRLVEGVVRGTVGAPTPD
jgi:zinc protease